MKMSTLGKILGVLGLMLLISAPYTYFVSTGEVWLFAAKGVLGLLLIGCFFATNYKNLGQFASGKSTFFFASSAALAIAALVALTAVNYIVAKKNKTWDLTSKKIYTLAPQTQSTLKGLKEKIKAIGFVESSHPYYEALDQLFSRYKREAPDKFEYTFKDPRKNPDLAAKYQLKEGQTTVVLTRGEGADATHTTLNVVSEQELTNALIKINAVGEQKVYFVQGHGEPVLDSGAPPMGPGGREESGSSLSELKKQLLQEGYSPEALTLLGKDEVPRDAALVVIAGSRTPIAPQEVKALRQYLEEGGRLLYFAEAGVEPGKEMAKLLADYGLEVDSGIVADDKFAVQSPYLVVSMFYGSHEITRLLQQMQMTVEFPTARGLTVLREGLLPGVKDEVVVQTSRFAWEESTPNDNPSRSTGEKTGQIPLVAVASRPIAGAAPGATPPPNKRYDEARLVVFGDSEILVDANWGHEANRNLVLNSLGWASNQVARITLRPPDRDISTLDMNPSLMAKLRFFSADLLPLTLLGIGLAIWLTRRDK